MLTEPATFKSASRVSLFLSLLSRFNSVSQEAFAQKKIKDFFQVLMYRGNDTWVEMLRKMVIFKIKKHCVRTGIEAIEMNYTLSIWCVCDLQSTFHLFVFEDANNQYVGMEIF